MHRILEVIREVRRVLKREGSVYLNLGDTYCGSWGTEGKGHPTSLLGLGRNNLRKHPARSPQARLSDGKWLQPKQLLLIPSRIAIALEDEGWILRNDIVYHKSNPMPASVKDRLNTTYEHVFHFVKSQRYFYDLDSIREPWKDTNPYDLERARNKHPGYQGKYASGQRIRGQPVGDPSRGKNPGDVIRNYHSRAKPYLENNPHRERQFGKKEAGHSRGKNPGDFWEIKIQPFHGGHFAVYPERLCEMPIRSSCPPGGIVLDPFCGSGTTCLVAKRLGRNWIGIDINPDYCEMARKRVAQEGRN